MSPENSFPSKDSLTDNGVVYLAFGSVFVAKALYSAETTKRFNPDVGICIVANVEFPGKAAVPFWNESVDQWVFLDEPAENNRKYKTNIIRYTPFSKSIYIDCDTFITGSLSHAWTFLDHFDICLRLQEGKQKHTHLEEYEVLPGINTPYLPHWNGGVVLFKKNERVESFFDSWQKNFNDSGLEFDQPSLVRTLFESNVRCLSLDTRWNGGFKPLDRGGSRIPIIIHYHSMYDARIERSLRKYHRAVVAVGGARKEEMEEHISDRNRMRARKEHVRYFLRRIYRRWWYRKYLGA